MLILRNPEVDLAVHKVPLLAVLLNNMVILRNVTKLQIVHSVTWCVDFFKAFLGALSKLRKTTINLIIFDVCRTVHRNIFL